MELLRSKFSGDRRRYVEGQYNLDLTYIYDDIIGSLSAAATYLTSQQWAFLEKDWKKLIAMTSTKSRSF